MLCGESIESALSRFESVLSRPDLCREGEGLLDDCSHKGPQAGS